MCPPGGRAGAGSTGELYLGSFRQWKGDLHSPPDRSARRRRCGALLATARRSCSRPVPGVAFNDEGFLEESCERREEVQAAKTEVSTAMTVEVTGFNSFFSLKGTKVFPDAPWDWHL